MCSFIFTNKNIGKLKRINEHSRLRGPDETTMLKREEFTFIHNLLSITGEFSPQPFVDITDGIYCIYNGEIYNYESFGEYKSDGECLVPLYRKYGVEFIKKLDGEFAIVLVDFNKGIILASSDVFATKPIWIGKGKENIGIASYKSSLDRLGFDNAKKIQANKCVILSLKNFKTIEELSLFDFDLNQYKNNYDDWLDAFSESVRKRTNKLREKVFMGLSSGYDSGAIFNELKKQKVNFKPYSIVAAENSNVLAKRHKEIGGTIIKMSELDYFKAKRFIDKKGEPIIVNGYDYKKDKGAVGLSQVCKTARKDGYKIYFSGQGADEIISDYGWGGKKIFKHSEFGGLFPEDLKKIFPWKSFYEGTQEDFITKEECVAGAYGIETRYPFLDKYLVQEFLWLLPKLKNKAYKAPLREYLIRNDVPFSEGMQSKVGFRAYANLRKSIALRAIKFIVKKIKNEA